MEIKQNTIKRSRVIFGVMACTLGAALIVCLSMMNTIDRRMNESATSNLLSATMVIQDALRDSLNKDLASLDIIGEFIKKDDFLKSEQIDTLSSIMGFDWLSIADGHGNDITALFGTRQASELPGCDAWEPESRGYSDAYIGQSGRQEITLWAPIYQDAQYIGTVFGGIVLTKYYSANVFTFYEGDGRTYLFNSTDGTWILKSLGTDGASVQHSDIYSLLNASGNAQEDILAFRQAVEEGKAGTALLNFNGEPSYLCFLPLESSTNWYVTTVIARDVLLRESSEVQRTIRWVLTILCIELISAAGFFAAWQIRKTKTEEVAYREKLFANLSANLDSAFLIYDKVGRKTVFVSDNIKRLLSLDRGWLSDDVGRLFDWCGIPQDDPQRVAFMEGKLEKAVVCEVSAENELGENNRVIRLEMIPADMEQELAVLTDITSDKEIQNSLAEAMEQAKVANIAKDEFLSAVSHDLRTPINGIVGMTAIAAAHIEDHYRVRDCLTKISNSTEHLLSLINEVLDMSQIESGKMELTSEPFNLAELLQDVLSVNYPGIQQKNHTVTVHVSLMEHEEVIGDPVRLTRATTNLISNAIKYTPSGGRIQLILEEKEPRIQGYGCYELTVADNGIGMSPEFLSRLFKPFEREADVRLSRIQGTGLGLSITKSIVDMMMGDIQVESEKGKGTTFHVTLNLRLNEQEQQSAQQLSGLPVLVVDDDETTCKTVSELLCNIGMNGEWTDNGFRAIEMVSQRHRNGADYLAVLLDWKMPEMDGVETARRIRAAVGSKVPIIILTAYEWSEIEQEARAAGVNAFLAKPIYRAKLLQKMTEITSGEMESHSLPRPISAGEIPMGKRVLLAEDNALNREIAVEFLRMIGVETDCAYDGESAVERFSSSLPGTYDLILMDIQMPKMNGYEATRKIRSLARPDGRTIPIVAMTADASQKDEQLAREAGMNDHLAKPVSVERLTLLIMRLLNKNGQEEAGNDETI